ncbi:MAG: DUF4338 domain-containing protein [Chloroflexi bacterium]|nr:DUF4338 domain-containing protein [Chloroflexota bacterium]
MDGTTVIQGRETTPEDIELVRYLIESNPSWHRTRLSKELCELWNWKAANGQIKDMAARSFLLKLEARGLITLPPRRQRYRNLRGARKSEIAVVLHSSDPITSNLKSLQPVRVEPVDAGNLDLFNCLISKYHYLSLHLVGKNMKYMAFDKEDRPLACLLFGSAAWKCAPRDEFIGWDAREREANVNMITNNTRFLILPWVAVPHLASHVLGRVARRIRGDWRDKYGHPVHLLETFVERDRFRGTCYRAANWTCVGETKGRSRQDRYTTMKVPVKDIYLYPLSKWFREALCG